MKYLTNNKAPTFAILSLTALACSLAFATQLTPSPTPRTEQSPLLDLTEDSSAQVPEFERITLPISVYIVDDDADDFSSERTVDEIQTIYAKVNEIWSQAGIVFEVQVIRRVTFPPSTLSAVTAGNFQPFYENVGHTISLPNPSLINAFYVRSIGGPNGIAPFGTRLFFVMDTPSVHDERVTSHEIGHILGLHHTLEDTGRLLYPGTNGMLLTEEEVVVARYNAQALLRLSP